MEYKKAIKVLTEFPGELKIGPGSEYDDAIRAGRDALTLLERYRELKERGYNVTIVLLHDTEHAHFGIDGEVFSCCDDPSCFSASGMTNCVRCHAVCSEACLFWQSIRG